MTPRALASHAAPRLDSAPSRLLPVATTAVAAIVTLLPVPIPGYAALTPAFALMAAYHWTVYRPDLLPPVALFAIGVGWDLLCGAPVGPTALVLLLARAGVMNQRRHFVDSGFPFIWAGFTILTAGATLFLWLLHLLLDGALPDLRGMVFRGVLTISLFPLASLLLGSLQRGLMGGG